MSSTPDDESQDSSSEDSSSKPNGSSRKKKPGDGTGLFGLGRTGAGVRGLWH